MAFQLAYVSSATHQLARPELDMILATSRRNNEALDVTGMLLYKGGNLMQVLEGDELTVRDLYARIARDPRHRGVMTLLEEEQEQRDFGDWSMAFRDLADPAVARTPGYSPFLNTPLTAAELAGDPSACRRLLASFKRSM